ncbi:hypothetical protein GE09DRAFT_1279775 [Coniochaeta sp. 2T2.1]|nr:hypothetical protein GE09DRAFT_1279775 [Coniochaeta sp. 2T2.1]
MDQPARVENSKRRTGGSHDIRPGAGHEIRQEVKAGLDEPLRSTNGRCGPPYGNATCAGYRGGQCCNAETWTCGDSAADCSRGTCYEGACPGHRRYATDGTCGAAHSNRLCAGTNGVTDAAPPSPGRAALGRVSVR